MRKGRHPPLQAYDLICKGEILDCRPEREAAEVLGLAGACWSAAGPAGSAAWLPAKRGCYGTANNARDELSGEQILLPRVQISLKQTLILGTLMIRSQKRCLWSRNLRILAARNEIERSFPNWPRQLLVLSAVLRKCPKCTTSFPFPTNSSICAPFHRTVWYLQSYSSAVKRSFILIHTWLWWSPWSSENNKCTRSGTTA